MKRFEYVEPASLKEACSLLSKYKDEAKVIAGGQSLVVFLRQRIFTPGYLINIKNLKELDYIRDGGGSLKIGALTTHRTLETSPVVRDRLPVLAEAERKLAHLQIRNWGTVGGDLCHADPAGDVSPPLLALGAKVKAVSTRGEREIALEDFFADYFTTVLESDEILTEIEIPYLPPNSAAAYRKETIISGDYPIASVAAMVGLDERRETVKEARIVLGAAGTTPIFAREASRILTGQKANGNLVKEAAEAASKEADPTTDILGSVEYKRKLVGLLTQEIVSLAIQRAKQ